MVAGTVADGDKSGGSMCDLPILIIGSGTYLANNDDISRTPVSHDVQVALDSPLHGVFVGKYHNRTNA